MGIMCSKGDVVELFGAAVVFILFLSGWSVKREFSEVA
jgi:hypothetical protein